MATGGVQTKKTKALLAGLHLLVGAGAIGGGLAGMMNPQTPLGMPIELLQHSPFSDYLIPGLILFSVLGLGNLFGLYLLARRSICWAHISSVLGLALIIFIVVQCLMLRLIDPLHVIFFGIGLLQTGLAMKILRQQRRLSGCRG